MSQSLLLNLSRKKAERQRRSDRPPPCPTMESKGDDVLSNPGDAPKNGQTRTPTLDQDQEGDGQGEKAMVDADGKIDLLLARIKALKDEKWELELRHGNILKEIHLVEEDNRSIDAHASYVERKIARGLLELATSSKDFEGEADRLKRALDGLEDERAKLADTNAELVAKISLLEAQLLAVAEGEDVDLQSLRSRAKLMEMRLLRITAHLRHSKEMAEKVVKDGIMMGEALEEDPKRVVDAFEELKTLHESALAEVRSELDRHHKNQSEHHAAIEAIDRNLKLCWMMAAVVSVGALFALAVALYDLLHSLSAI